MKTLSAVLAALIVLLASTLNCFSAETRVVLASTTSTENTGLFKVLLPAYYAWTKLGDVRIDVVAVGTGKAIEIAKRGDADILLVHDREREDAFVAEGFGVKRYEIMYNDFVIAGPADDPAGVARASGGAAAFGLMAAKGATFVSRGDDSGTNARELRLWKAAGVDAKDLKGYLSVGQGMEATLRIADDKAAYTLSDRATYNTVRGSLKNIKSLYEGDPALFNQYAVIAVNPAKFPHVRYDIARDFIDFVTGPAGQKLIGGFKDAGGGSLFIPNAKR